MTTIDQLLDSPTEAIERPRPSRRYKGVHRVRRQRFGNRVLIALGLGVMLFSAVTGTGLQLTNDGDEKVFAPAAQPSWVEPSHPVGTGESLRLKDGTGR